MLRSFLPCPLCALCVGEFTMWSGTNFQFETIIQAHETPVRTMTFTHNGNFLVSGDDGGTVSRGALSRASRAAHQRRMQLPPMAMSGGTCGTALPDIGRPPCPPSLPDLTWLVELAMPSLAEAQRLAVGRLPCPPSMPYLAWLVEAARPSLG